MKVYGDLLQLYGNLRLIKPGQVQASSLVANKVKQVRLHQYELRSYDQRGLGKCNLRAYLANPVFFGGPVLDFGIKIKVSSNLQACVDTRET